MLCKNHNVAIQKYHVKHIKCTGRYDYRSTTLVNVTEYQTASNNGANTTWTWKNVKHVLNISNT